MEITVASITVGKNFAVNNDLANSVLYTGRVRYFNQASQFPERHL